MQADPDVVKINDTAAGYEFYNGSEAGSMQQGMLRWPRQETLMLLEIRTRLHPMFKQAAAQKAPLWDEVSRIMAEEHGYQRSGKKCKEKLDNLYKYYKKTKAANGSRKDGRNYRFFKQLEALYGENNNTTLLHDHLMITNNAHTANHQMPGNLQVNHESLQAHINLCNEFNVSISSEEESEEEEQEELEWDLKVRELIEIHMKKLKEMQESWLDKILQSTERMDQERAFKDEAWRNKKLAQSEQEERAWARERALIEARNVALFDALGKFGCRRCNDSKRGTEEEEYSTSMETCDDRDDDIHVGDESIKWAEYDELANLVRLQGWVEPELEFS